MASFEIRELEYFIEAAKVGNISDAARRLFISHQSLSKTILRIEQTMDVPLLVRSKTGVALTDFGERFLEKAEATLMAESECEKLVNSFHDVMTGSVSIGVMASCFMENGGPIDGAKLLSYCELHPHMLIDLSDQTSDSGLDAVRDGTVDLCIHDAFLDRTHFDGVILHENRLVVVISRKNRLSRRSALALSDLSDMTFALPAHNADFVRFVESKCRHAGFEMKRWPLYLRLANWAKVVADNDIAVVLPLDRAWRTITTENVAVIPLFEPATTGHSPTADASTGHGSASHASASHGPAVLAPASHGPASHGPAVLAPIYLLWRKDHTLTEAQWSAREMIIELYRDAYPD